MCLDSLITGNDPPIMKETIAWKVFQKDEGDLHFMYYTLDGQFCTGVDYRRVRRKRWLTAIPRVEHFDSQPQDTYQTGFHCYQTRKDARKIKKAQEDSRQHLVVVKVRARGLTTIGYQNLLKVSVFSQILVP